MDSSIKPLPNNEEQMTKKEFEKFLETPNGKKYAMIALDTVAEASAMFEKGLTSITAEALLSMAKDIKLSTEKEDIVPSLIKICVLNTIRSLQEIEKKETEVIFEQMKTTIKA
jgi:type II secretory ATPase GspE/PulE/Tfp pilus assembly ATPase PilB-like protein